MEPVPNHGLPEALAQAATKGIYAAVLAPAAFESQLDPARCSILIPMTASELTVREEDGGVVGEVQRPFSLTYLPSGARREAVQLLPTEHVYLSIAAKRATTGLGPYAGRENALETAVLGHVHSDIAPLARMIRRQLFAPTCPNAPFLTSTAGLLLSYAAGSTAESTASPARKVFTDGSLRRVLRELDACIDTGRALADVADRIGLSPSVLSKRFRASVGCSPYRYVNERRVGRARELLESTDLPISDIAYMIGFTSQAHLTSRFKDLLGVTPGRYRSTYSRLDHTLAGEQYTPRRERE